MLYQILLLFRFKYHTSVIEAVEYNSFLNSRSRFVFDGDQISTIKSGSTVLNFLLGYVLYFVASNNVHNSGTAFEPSYTRETPSLKGL